MIINYKVKLDFEDKQVEVADTTFVLPIQWQQILWLHLLLLVIKKPSKIRRFLSLCRNWVQLYNDKITPLLKRLEEEKNVSLYHFGIVNRTN